MPLSTKYRADPIFAGDAAKRAWDIFRKNHPEEMRIGKHATTDWIEKNKFATCCLAASALYAQREINHEFSGNENMIIPGFRTKVLNGITLRADETTFTCKGGDLRFEEYKVTLSYSWRW